MLFDISLCTQLVEFDESEAVGLYFEQTRTYKRTISTPYFENRDYISPNTYVGVSSKEPTVGMSRYPISKYFPYRRFHCFLCCMLLCILIRSRLNGNSPSLVFVESIEESSLYYEMYNQLSPSRLNIG